MSASSYPPSTPEVTSPHGSAASPDHRISDSQRTGSVVGIALFVAASMAFSAASTFAPARWRYVRAFLFALWSGGIVLQTLAFFAVLSVPPIKVKTHKIAMLVFYAGVSSVLTGFLLHVGLAILGDLLEGDY